MSSKVSKPYSAVIREEFIPNNIKVDIYTRTWEPANVAPKANIVFIHGQGEHVTRYDHVFNEFAKAGLKVHSFDQVGCGKTGQRSNDLGGAMGLARVLLDVNDAIDRVYDPDVPLFLMGHSFGGASTLNYLAVGARKELIHGALVSAPCIQVSDESAPIMPLRFLLNNLSPLFPSIKVPVNVEASYMSRDKEEVRKYSEDPLIFSRSALVQARDVVFEGEALSDGRYKLINVQRLHICHGSDDKAASFEATKNLADKIKSYEKVPHLQFKEYPGYYHELHNEVDKDQVVESHLSWFMDQL